MFDIIVPIWKMKPAYLSDCLASIEAQQHKDFKCYIVDGSPEDWELYGEQMELIEKYTEDDRRFEYHRHPNLEEPFVSEAQNYGLSLGSNPYVQFLGGDDFFYAHHLAYMKHGIETEINENVAFWFCMVRANEKKVLDFQDFKIGRVKTWLFNHYLMYEHLSIPLLKYFHYGNPIYMNGLVLKRERVEEVEGFDEEMVISEDVNMVLKIIKKGYRGRFLSYQGAYLRLHPEQSTDDRGEVPYDRDVRFEQSKQRNNEMNEDCIVGRSWRLEIMEGTKSEEELKKLRAEDMQKVCSHLGVDGITDTQYEELIFMSSGAYHTNTILEVEKGEMMFLLHTDEEEKMFKERDIVV